MTLWAWTLIGGIVAGIGGTVLVVRNQTPPPPVVVREVVAEKQQDVVLQLTDLDLIKPICAPAYIEEKGDLLCRAMFCRQLQRGTDKASDLDCESIANIQNKIAIIEFCDRVSADDRKSCVELFDRRI